MTATNTLCGTTLSILRWTILGVGPTFYPSLGRGQAEQFRQIAEYCLQNKLPLRFVPVPKDELDRMLHFFPGSTAQADRDTFDYLYRSEDLKFFPGQKTQRSAQSRQPLPQDLRDLDLPPYRA